MYRNPKYYPPEQEAAPASPPAERGRRLATFARGRDQELRIALDAYQDKPYISVRLWNRDERGWFPTAKGCSVRISEIAGVVEALSAVLVELDAGDQAPPRQEGAQTPARHAEGPRPARTDENAAQAPKRPERKIWDSPLGRDRRCDFGNLPPVPTGPQPDFNEE